jgi:4-amino-4-deoxy-L-arabinose transferase-like glycosyltransferase
MALRAMRPWLWVVLLLGLAVRLVQIGEPLIDKQAWRQTDTAAVARNYYEEGYDLFWPRIDWRGTTPGYVEMNFPLYPYLVAGLYSLADGAYEWLGRLFSALCSVTTAVLLYWLAKRLFADELTGILAAFFFLFSPLNIYFGRVFMPEPLMLLLSVAALLCFDRWAESGRHLDGFLAVISAALCFMVKIPTLYLGFALVALSLDRWGVRFILRLPLWIYLVLVLSPAALWYWHAAELFAETGLTFGIWNRYGYDKWSQDVLATPDFYKEMVWRFVHSVYNPIGALFVLLGLQLARSSRRSWVLWGWFGGLILYLWLVPEGNRKLHYYQLPFVPVGALLAASSLAAIYKGQWGLNSARNWRRGQRVGLLVVVLGATVVYSAGAVGPYYEQPNNIHVYYTSCYETGRIADAKLPTDALLVVGDLDDNAGTPFRAQSPTLLYYCHRKGWQITPDEFAVDRLDSLSALGADFFLTATAFATGNPVFWRDLLQRGVSTPSAYPRLWTDERAFRKYLSRQKTKDRHFVLVALNRR